MGCLLWVFWKKMTMSYKNCIIWSLIHTLIPELVESWYSLSNAATHFELLIVSLQHVSLVTLAGAVDTSATAEKETHVIRRRGNVVVLVRKMAGVSAVCWVSKNLVLSLLVWLILYNGVSLLYNERVGGYIGFTPSIRLSVRPALCVCSVAPRVLVGSTSYLYILSNNIRKCAACKVSCKISIFGNFFKFVTFTLSSFDLGSDVNH